MKSKILYILALPLFLIACNSNNCKTDKTIEFTDSYGKELKLEDTPQRVISCSPAITEVMFALHEEKKLVGRTSFCVYPPEVENVPIIGGLMDPSLEVMIQLKPDLVMASTHFKKETAHRIEQLGMPFAWLLSQESIGGAGDLILNIGKLIGEEEKADSLWNYIQSDIANTINKLPATNEKPTVYYAVGYGKGGDFTAGGDTFISELINKAGGINIAQDVNGWNYNLETLMQQDPDIILIEPSMKNAFCQHEHYKELSAVKNNRVYAVDHHMVQLNGPRINQALRTFAEIFYPEVKF
ncbi:ABC transporter substrate-binding protein [Carboxylicivirga linearis]|uniref:ABC transporter substrate-binding protein n=1 Tax=Carboxylicivirga linearis TaxID=1628157 RepID=A0ABS5JXY7_9BACT|nr:ABC transporter substrate-binding protein [Carboxylicivirga linearis]MBS2099741.1 ABC transporter substrate-binding protein [Carboxylicivirga linearis]